MAVKLIQKEQKPAEPKTYKIGDTFKYVKIESVIHFILASVDVKSVILVSLLDGKRYGGPVLVGDSTSITEKEFGVITQGEACRFSQTDYTLTEL